MKYTILTVIIAAASTLAANITALVLYNQRIQALEQQATYLMEKDELSRPFVDKDGNLRGTDGNEITIRDGWQTSTSLYYPPEAVMQMRREAKEAQKKKN